MKQSLYSACAVALLALYGQPALAQHAAVDVQAHDIAVKVCSECHGPGGDGNNPQFPKLAAQQPQYLEAQLRAFRAHERAEPEAQHYMWGAASRDIDENLIAAVARYFASQPAPKGVSGDPALVAKGKKLFQEGSPQRQIQACASCHGPEAKGNGVFPRLAGQHGQYLLKQLRLIQTAVRKAPVMHGIIEHLDDADMQAVAAYLQSLD